MGSKQFRRWELGSPRTYRQVKANKLLKGDLEGSDWRQGGSPLELGNLSLGRTTSPGLPSMLPAET